MQTLSVLATYAAQNTTYPGRHYAKLNTTGDLHRIACAGIAKGRKYRNESRIRTQQESLVEKIYLPLSCADIRFAEWASKPIRQSGEGGIRTLGPVSRTQHFQCCTIGHSATSPNTTSNAVVTQNMSDDLSRG